jgi:hypothetical protein
VLIGLLLPAVQKVREAANRINCGNNLKQFVLACHNYHDVYNFVPPSRLDKSGGVSWAVLLLPYIEQDNFYNQWTVDQWYYVNGEAVRRSPIKIYYCPTRRGPNTEPAASIIGDQPDYHQENYPGALGDYAGCVGDKIDDDYYGNGGNGVLVVSRPPWLYYPGWPPHTRKLKPWTSQVRFADITDGLSNTLFFGEKHILPNTFGMNSPSSITPEFGDGSIYNGDHPWVVARAAGEAHPLAQNKLEPFKMQFGSWHSGVCLFAYGDGRVATLDNTINGVTLGRLAKRNDGEIQ